MALNTAGQTATGAAPSGDSPRWKSGRIVFDGTAITTTDEVAVFVGFTPKYICWENITDRIKNEWYEGMAAESSINTVANGTRTLSVTGSNKGFTVCDSDGTANASGRYFKISQNSTLGAILASKTTTWVAAA